MIVASVHHFLSYWSIPSWAVAVGTGTLAYATWRLGTRAQAEADSVREQSKAVGEQVKLERQQLEASQRPFVLPVTAGWLPGAWAPVERDHDPSVGDRAEPWMMLQG